MCKKNQITIKGKHRYLHLLSIISIAKVMKRVFEFYYTS